MKTVRTESSLELRETMAAVNLTLQRIENKVDHLAEMAASHGERLDRLEGRG